LNPQEPKQTSPSSTSNDEPPEIEQPNVYPVDWTEKSPEIAKIYARAKKEHWDPADIPWDELNPKDYDPIQRTAMAYWWALLANFENSAAAAFSRALVHVSEQHYEDPIKKVTGTIVLDECMHDECCMTACNRLCPRFLSGWKPKSDLENRALRNIRWVYYNGGRYWNAYLDSYNKYRFPLIFTSFMMGEACASKLFHEMSLKAEHPAFKEAFTNITRDESRHLAYTWLVLEQAVPSLTEAEKQILPKRLRHGFVFLSMILFQPPKEFWQLPSDFLDVQNRMEEIARDAGLGVLTLEEKRKAWSTAIMEIKRKLDKHGLPFPDLPEIGISGTR
jgi:hypothetical protein